MYPDQRFQVRVVRRPGCWYWCCRQGEYSGTSWRKPMGKTNTKLTFRMITIRNVWLSFLGKLLTNVSMCLGLYRYFWRKKPFYSGFTLDTLSQIQVQCTYLKCCILTALHIKHVDERSKPDSFPNLQLYVRKTLEDSRKPIGRGECNC